MVYEKFVEAWKAKYIEAYLDCYHEDWQITFHSTGRVMGLEELSDQIGNWMVTGKFDEHRCLYENEDILVLTMQQHLKMEAGKQFYNRTVKKMDYFGVQKREQPLLKRE